MKLKTIILAMPLLLLALRPLLLHAQVTSHDDGVVVSTNPSDDPNMVMTGDAGSGLQVIVAESSKAQRSGHGHNKNNDQDPLDPLMALSRLIANTSPTNDDGKINQQPEGVPAREPQAAQ